jgi:hypothetical protein
VYGEQQDVVSEQSSNGLLTLAASRALATLWRLQTLAISGMHGGQQVVVSEQCVHFRRPPSKVLAVPESKLHPKGQTRLVRERESRRGE